ncbi:L-seryl-tRNA(Sec) selenium transferase [Rhodopila globiformis]|uniref:L-seryl-tRNA(Sec) selenium transferase n=1 Tax=Rhodopila globiformis TaxID=1071 RepID=A0A2S6MWS1_RHOGL|nr:L-seryl-tRNA(Sec) selenium transferase [Rhodopila globiformis]PPQ26812.1 L-seryl-tRNA(Sec) selenium transferase [Rhodopila globiformis]
MVRQPSPLPSVDALLRAPETQVLLIRFGRTAVTAALRDCLSAHRRLLPAAVPAARIIDEAADQLSARFARSQRLVFNMTGTVLHTNLGRALLPPEAAEAAAEAMRNATNLEFDLASGRRGERDDHVAGLLRALTGAEAATVVNNNAAAVMLVLNTLALGKEVPVSRGELIEIGGAFRVPDIMARSGAILREVGTTNRTHARDYAAAIGPATGALMRVHQANFAIVGFTASVPAETLGALAHDAGLPLIEDLGSGSLVDLAQWGLPHERTPRESLTAGVGVVTFSGDKLLGGPQAGLIVGHEEVISSINRNPLKRALRLDKGRLAALEIVLRMYLDPQRLAERLPALRLLTRSEAEVRATAERICPVVAERWPDRAVEVRTCRSQIGSGALPIDMLPSAAVAIGGKSLEELANFLRSLPRPIIGRIAQGRLFLDCRCLEPGDEAAFIAQLR